MNANNSGRSLVQGLVPVIVIIVGLVGLYYLYQYLFGTRALNSAMLIDKTQTAQTDLGKPIVIESSKLPRIYEGGEFTLTTWIYINNWNYRNGSNKHIMSIGGTDTDIIRVYLDGAKATLHVRLHTGANGVEGFIDAVSAAPVGSSGVNTPVSTGPNNFTGNLVKTNYDALFSGITPSVASADTPICDVPSIDLQKWVHVAISVNGKSVDVYTDGRLARSCILPTFYKVPAGGYTATILDKGGFGGSISTSYLYDTALNPEDVYKMYMAGPEPITNFMDWLKSFFAPRKTL